MGRTAARGGADSGRQTGQTTARKKVLSRQQYADGTNTSGKKGNWQTGGQRRYDSLGKARLHWPRTLTSKGPAAIAPEHLRYSQKRQRASRLQLFVLDCSASMLTGNRLALCKGMLQRLLERAYQQRDHIALICFAGDHAELRISPRPATSTNTHNNAAQWLRPIMGGGATPLVEAVSLADRLLKQWREQNVSRQHSVWLISDGRCSEMPNRPANADLLQIVDCEQQRINLGGCQKLAQRWQCDYLLLDEVIAT